MQLSAAARTLEARLDGADARFLGVSTDTRTLAPGQLFFALRGPRFDAHDMIPAALAAGAAGAVVERAVDTALPTIEVADSRRALGVLARSWRARFSIPVIAVTGSAGKTTVKEMVAAIMAVEHRVLATRGNLNNDIGVPLTLFELGAEHEAAVIEMGANRAGDIADLCTIARPTVGVVTLCAPVHLEGFGDIETVARTKGQIVSSLGADGVAVINDDDAFAPLWRELAGSRRTIGFGLGAASEVRASDLAVGVDGASFTLHVGGTSGRARIAHPGTHNVRNALAAAAAASAAGVTFETVVRGLAAARPVGGRLQTRRGPHGARIIDDSYNANPTALLAALDVLAAHPAPRWLVLGDMGELGAEAARFHREAGAAAARAGVARLFTFGPLAAGAHAGFGGPVAGFDSHEALTDALVEALASCDETVSVLIKGSRAVALDRVAVALERVEDVQC
ncbi:MAG: UDP-N-acetylmuramoyl-tripeptide--D-alanyl-D-alanine ligase [Gammaproteobacteria bacterium]|nr:UDP-N-acetylmuramoyl-tripeptide--D-alanyl-D-alanine ligase [Gammaproteobacteria bacterium]MCP5199392.1 UDP-N-acetylmuramoyl-tripeptide--D-alanyl-D-alanine ligase [Gammaproteobacteria bacterium]